MKDGIQIRGAREHNLKNFDVFIPRDKITVVTGLSGSGKSSLAFSTVYAEGQRRYVESLSAYARNFLEQLKKPDVDSILGLSPSIAIDQKTTSTSPRSTVGTVTDVYDYLRLLYSKIGIAKCPTHSIELVKQSEDDIVKQVMSIGKNKKFIVLAPMVRGKKGEFHNEFEKWLKLGYVKARIDGEIVDLETVGKLIKTKVHHIDLVIDRLVQKPTLERRIRDAVLSAIELSGGYVRILKIENNEEDFYSKHSVCPMCGFNAPELEAKFFSFNDPKGACGTCNGLGYVDEYELDNLEEYEDETEDIDELALNTCPECQGLRLRHEALNVYLGERTIGDLSQMPLTELKSFLHGVKWNKNQKMIVEKVIKNLTEKVDFLCNLGVGYLSLLRPSRTLSGGEAQRIRLATQLGSPLIGVLYVLDEPSIGLHPRDHSRLLDSLIQLRDNGNTILIVEHDEDTILCADHIIDLGPGAGRLGGEIVGMGTGDTIRKSNTLTGKYLSGRLSAVQNKKRSLDSKTEWIEILGASGNNLKSIDVKLPLHKLTTITGVSGSGKSTLILETLFRYMSNHFHDSGYVVQPHKEIHGIESIDNVVDINQKPIGRTPRSNPATYVGLFSQIRTLFSQLPESRMRGYKPGRFSFNVKGGRCENCQGAGQIKVEMHFMADVYVECEVCNGKRFNRDTLDVKYKEKSIADILDMSINEATEFFTHHKRIHIKLETLQRVGLGYIKLGQSSTTLSGGEAQRIKLCKELSKRGLNHILYILDEPTTGLHFDDTSRLIGLLQDLVDKGHSVVVIEHNLDVIRSSDYILDLGPEGGKGGGEIVAKGFPLSLNLLGKSATSEYLKKT